MLAGILFCTITAGAERAKSWESTLSLPTYPLGPDDPNPHFRVYEGSIYYPYTLQDNFTTARRDVSHRVLMLENQFLRIAFMPDIGGRIYSAFDKTTGDELFYRNKVVKPGHIALRGAWVNGGVEWNNGPQEHTVTSFAPVDATFVNHDDGSASVVIGDTEAVNGTRWTAWITLRSAKAYIEERIRIENTTDLPQPFYFWNNAKYAHHDRVRYIVPASLMIDHGGKRYRSWPVDNGIDLSYVKNYDAPTSLFSVDCPFDFFGAYDLARDHGVVIYADRREVVGKKIWTWGMGDDARAALANLTDDDTGDIEIQSGPLPTQEDYGLLLPHQCVEWHEWWYPVHGLGDGFDYATRDVAVKVDRIAAGPGRHLRVRVIATAAFPDATIMVRQPANVNGAPQTLHANLSPNNCRTLEFESANADPILVSVYDASGAELASFVSPLPVPKVEAPQAESPEKQTDETAESRYLQAGKLARRLAPVETRKTYEDALAIDPGFAAALRDLAMLDLAEGHNEAAEQGLEKALERNPDDGLAWYYLALARFRNGNLDQALDATAHGIRAVEHAAIAHDLAGRIYARKGNWPAALKSFDAAIHLAPEDTRARDHRLMALYSLHDNAALEGALKDSIGAQPLALVPRLLEIFSRGNSPREPDVAKDLLRLVGWDEFMLTHAALAFAEVGLYEEAGQITGLLLTDETTNTRPLPYYFSAYFLHCQEQEGTARELLKRARSITADYVFPKGADALAILDYAVTAQPDDARAWYYLGNLYAGLNRTDDAASAWTCAVTLDPLLGVAQRNLAVHANRGNDLNQAKLRYEAAIAARPGDQTLYRDLAHILIALKKAGDAIALLETTPLAGNPRLDIVQLLADTYLHQDNPARALETLAAARFTNREGNSASWATFSKAHLVQGKKHFDSRAYDAALKDFRASLTYPANLGVGRPSHAEESESYYWIGTTLEQLDQPGEAQQAFALSAQGEKGSPAQNEYRTKSQQKLSTTTAQPPTAVP